MKQKQIHEVVPKRTPESTYARRIIMKTKKIFTLLAVTFVIVAIGSLSWASGGGGVKISLMATKHHPDASGTAVINDKDISIKAKGLKPDGVYTVWFVNMKPEKHETGAGDAPYMFKADSQGNGNYFSALKSSPFGKWKMLMIVFHPTGDPSDMKNMVGGLSGGL